MAARTTKWRRYPAKSKDWPPTATLTLNTPSASQTRITANNPLDFAIEVITVVGGTVVNTRTLPANDTSEIWDVTHDEVTQAIEVRVDNSIGHRMAYRAAGAV